MLQRPKKTKFGKAQKGRISFLNKIDQKIVFGKYALVAKQPTILTAAQIAAITLAIKRKLKKDPNSEFWLRVFPHIPVTKKPAEVRMGKGKGSVDHWVTRIRAGSVIVELKCSNIQLAKIIFKIVNSKLPIKTTTVETRSSN